MIIFFEFVALYINPEYLEYTYLIVLCVQTLILRAHENIFFLFLRSTVISEITIRDFL